MNGKGEEMVKIIFGLIGIVIILAEILNIISTQRLWTKKITLWLAVYCFHHKKCTEYKTIYEIRLITADSFVIFIFPY